MKKSILITGASGMLGIHLKKYFPDAICPTRHDYDLTNPIHVESMLSTYAPNIVIHAAAKVGGMLANLQYPLDFFEENILINTLVLKYANKYNVSRFIGILSTCIYPDISKVYPMKEIDLFSGPPAPSNFSYGYAKRCLAVQIDACNIQYGTKYNYVIPSNLYSENDRIHDDKKTHFITALLKKIKLAEKLGKKEIIVFGDGTPLRQFMYADDLAKIIKIMVTNDITDSFNIAPENQNYSISDMVNMTLKVLGKDDWNVIYDTDKPNGQYRKDVSIDIMKLHIKNFEFTKFEDGIKKTYAFLKQMEE